MKILFVCTGNTCRSPMAEAVLKNKLKTLGVSGVKVSSCGTRAHPGNPVNPLAAEVLRENGLRVPRGGSKLLTERAIRLSDAVFCIVDIPGELKAEKTYDFPECYGLGHIEDPYGGTLGDYREAFKKIEAACEILASEIKKHINTEKREEQK